MFPDPEDPQKAILLKYYLKAVRQVKRNPDGTIAESDSDSDLEETAANEDEDDYEDDDVSLLNFSCLSTRHFMPLENVT